MIRGGVDIQLVGVKAVKYDILTVQLRLHRLLDRMHDPPVIPDKSVKVLGHAAGVLDPHDIHLDRPLHGGQQVLVGAVGILAQNVLGRRFIRRGKGRPHHDHIVGVPGDSGLLLQLAAIELGQAAAQIRSHGHQHDVVPRRHLPLLAVGIGGNGGILRHFLQAVRQLAIGPIHIAEHPQLEHGDRLQIPLRLHHLHAQFIGIAAHLPKLRGTALAVAPHLGIDIGLQCRVLYLHGEV